MTPFHRMPTMTSTVKAGETATFFMSEIADSVNTLKRFKEFHPAYRPEPNIRCGDVKRLWREIDRVVGREVKQDAEPRPIASMTYCGVPVVENNLIPANIVIVMMGDEVVNIINLDKSSSHSPTPSERETSA